MKRILCLLIALMLVLSALPALADTPKPIEIIPYEQLPEPSPGQHHYLLLCADSWGATLNNIGNTDGIVLVTLDTYAHRVMLTSLIRDALVSRPDQDNPSKMGIGRVNYVAKNLGLETFLKVLSQHLGIKIEKYILFDFQQIANIVDHLGGVDIEVTSAEANYLTAYPLNPGQTIPTMTNRAGSYWFTGRAAVIYMRIRKAGGGGDFMRTQRVRTVLSLLADKCRQISYDDAKALVDSVMENQLSTNMNLDEMLTAMDQAYGLRDCTIEELRLPPDGMVHPINYAGMAVQELDWPGCREALRSFLGSSWLVYDDEE